MSRIVSAASAAAIAITAIGTFMITEPTFALGMTNAASVPEPVTLALTPNQPASTEMVADQNSGDVPAVDLPLDADADSAAIDAAVAELGKSPAPQTIALPAARSLSAMVAAMPAPAAMDAEMRCLASAIYFESKGESHTGQLAVAHVVLNRAQSGRFPRTLCGVVHQPSQFSFVVRGKMPPINTSSLDWKEAVAIAHIAKADGWKNAAPGALFFHASRVSPGWKRPRVAQIENHIFYR